MTLPNRYKVKSLRRWTSWTPRGGLKREMFQWWKGNFSAFYQAHQPTNWICSVWWNQSIKWPMTTYNRFTHSLHWIWKLSHFHLPQEIDSNQQPSKVTRSQYLTIYHQWNDKIPEITVNIVKWGAGSVMDHQIILLFHSALDVIAVYSQILMGIYLYIYLWQDIVMVITNMHMNVCWINWTLRWSSTDLTDFFLESKLRLSYW